MDHLHHTKMSVMSLGKGGGGGGGNVLGLHCTAAVPVCPGHSRPDTQ